MEAVEKKVGITKNETASNDLQITTSSPPKRGHEPVISTKTSPKITEKRITRQSRESVNEVKSGQNDAQEPSFSKELSLVIAKEHEVKPPEQSGEPSILVLVGQGYDPFAPVDKKMSKLLTDWVNLDPHEDLNVVMEPFVTMVPYLLVVCAGSGEQCVQHTLEPYTYERVTVGVPQCRAGDCGVFTLKYIGCHALGMSFPPEVCNKNAKAIREKMVLDIFKETPKCHEKENEDNDENMGTYDKQGS
ncbi:hypothetical protein F2Q70_00017892 [Brassica cretica]|uniref:Ubiquitin-like protease family profile domain-containing protein n=1 Tax=Brassica cretica TaxID=69181 RepID=A0A3N6R6W9_BRACR|nr:hypothetical protein F2Q70_00017892 [Brassica cretica]KAF2595949.1 hypothetical protein F2Q68_00010869 [Brassica cretica]